VEDTRSVRAEIVVIGAPVYGEFVAGRLGITAERVLSETDSSLLVVRPFPDSA
jgi:nucleotide-binding universal stress UspA family protein